MNPAQPNSNYEYTLPVSSASASGVTPTPGSSHCVQHHHNLEAPRPNEVHFENTMPVLVPNFPTNQIPRPPPPPYYPTNGRPYPENAFNTVDSKTLGKMTSDVGAAAGLVCLERDYYLADNVKLQAKIYEQHDQIKMLKISNSELQKNLAKTQAGLEKEREVKNKFVKDAQAWEGLVKKYYEICDKKDKDLKKIDEDLKKQAEELKLQKEHLKKAVEDLKKMDAELKKKDEDLKKKDADLSKIDDDLKKQKKITNGLIDESVEYLTKRSQLNILVFREMKKQGKKAYSAALHQEMEKTMNDDLEEEQKPIKHAKRSEEQKK